ncbi:hypothetical protein FMJ38_24810 [Klebsiella variicola]|nr:hypothetical protein [Klebsiella variicola]
MALCEFKRGQAHRADLTTSRIDDGSREPEMKKAHFRGPGYLLPIFNERQHTHQQNQDCYHCTHISPLS